MVQIPSLYSFIDWLLLQGKTDSTIKQIKNYAIKYGHILDTGDASVLLTLSPRNRHHALVSLASLAKFSGRYGQFVQIRQNYSLKWTSGNDSLQALQRFFNPEDTALSLEGMLQAIKQMIRLLPSYMGKIVKFGCLVGLRSAEIVESVRLINNDSYKYYNPHQQVLQHYKFPQFLRTTKKAYISFVTNEMVSGIAQKGCKTPTYNAIRMACYHKGIPCNMRYCRKIHATHLYQSGIPVEIIDALQGRTPASLFAKWYYKPSLDYKEKILDSLSELSSKL